MYALIDKGGRHSWEVRSITEAEIEALKSLYDIQIFTDVDDFMAAAVEHKCLVQAIQAIRIERARQAIETDPRLPCDIHVGTGTVIRAGCRFSTLLKALEQRGMPAIAEWTVSR